MNEALRIERADASDAGALITVQNRAFYADYVRYGVCPGYDRTHESMLHSIACAYTYKLLMCREIVGTIIVSDRGAGHFYLGGLCVVPEFEHRGIGRAAMSFLANAFPSAKRWSLETPVEKTRNIDFYTRCGFFITSERTDGHVRLACLERMVSSS